MDNSLSYEEWVNKYTEILERHDIVCNRFPFTDHHDYVNPGRFSRSDIANLAIEKFGNGDEYKALNNREYRQELLYACVFYYLNKQAQTVIRSLLWCHDNEFQSLIFEALLWQSIWVNWYQDYV